MDSVAWKMSDNNNNNNNNNKENHQARMLFKSLSSTSTKKSSFQSPLASQHRRRPHKHPFQSPVGKKKTTPFRKKNPFGTRAQNSATTTTTTTGPPGSSAVFRKHRPQQQPQQAHTTNTTPKQQQQQWQLDTGAGRIAHCQSPQHTKTRIGHDGTVGTPSKELLQSTAASRNHRIHNSRSAHDNDDSPKTRPDCQDPVALTLLNRGKEDLDLLVALDVSTIDDVPKVSDSLLDVKDKNEVATMAKPVPVVARPNR